MEIKKVHKALLNIYNKQDQYRGPSFTKLRRSNNNKLFNWN